MKNIVFALALSVSFLFFSCSNEESDATNGILDLTIVNNTYHYPVTEFVYDNSSTLIEGRSGTDGIQIRFEGKAVKKYTLGLCSTADSIGICMDNAETVSNTVSYKDPSDNRQYSVVCGTLTIRDYTSENVEGVFTAKALDEETKRDLYSGTVNPEDVMPLLKEVSAQFTAVRKK